LANGTGNGGADDAPPGPGNRSNPGERSNVEPPSPARPVPGGGRGQPRLGPPLRSRSLGAILSVAGVALLVIGLITLRGRPPEGRPPGAAPGSSTTASPSRSGPPGTPTTQSSGPAGTQPPPTSPPAAATTPAGPTAPRAPLTVLNNSRVSGLGEQVADQARRKEWRVAQVGNFAGRIPVSTIYFTPGDAAGERAAQQFAAEFPAVRRVFPRYVGLPATPAGIVLVVTRDWLSPDP
jgi:hypothetical protein